MSNRYCYAAIWLPKDRLKVHRFRMRCERDTWIADGPEMYNTKLRFVMTVRFTRWHRAVHARLASAAWENDVAILELSKSLDIARKA